MPFDTRRAASFLPKVFLCIMAAFVAAGVMPVPGAQAGITATGGVTPTTDPTTWDGSTSPYIGTGSDGTLTIDGGSTLTTGCVSTGNKNVLGTISVDGTGSSWTFNGLTSYNGTTVFNITNGATVTSTGAMNMGGYRGSGTFNVDGVGSTLTGGLNLGGTPTGKGYLNVTNGGTVNSNGVYIYRGAATTDGAGSTWNIGGDLIIGQYDPSSLNVLNGSTVNVTGTLSLYSTSSVTFGDSGGTLKVRTIAASSSQFTGTGTIIAINYLSDFGDLVLDAAHTPTIQTVDTWNGTGQNIAIKVNPMDGGDLAVGYRNAGSLTVADGRTLASSIGYIGYNAGVNGTATVTGSGSNWTMSGALTVGNSGTGSLTVANGAAVSSAGASLGANAGSTGTVTVDGSGSLWSVTGDLAVGPSGMGICFHHG
jgi:T5SS/PEP-CTERM-associated repeat protein